MKAESVNLGAIFDTQYLQNTLAERCGFLDLNNWYITQQVVSKTMMKLFSFSGYLTLNVFQTHEYNITS